MTMPNNPFALLNALKSNPAAFLQQRGFQLPQNMTDPQQIVNHFVQTGRFTQAQVNQAYQMYQQQYQPQRTGGGYK